MKTLIFSIVFAGISLTSYTQQTGDFQISVPFSEPDYNFTRELYFHVPLDYTPTQSYKLVVGFRGGPHANAGQFRDQLSFLSDSIGAIILCPENADHFWNQEGLTKQLFNYSVDTALALYNIDTNFIYLTGLSYGGRHSVIVSMDTDNGPIPNLRGVIPFAAGADSHLEPDYVDISSFPPACICIGLDDSQTFIDVANTLHDDIQANGGNSILNEISGVGHTVEFPTYPAEMMECFGYIESTYGTAEIPQIEGDLGITLYPNPAMDELHISYDTKVTPTSLIIRTSGGKQVAAYVPTKTTLTLPNLPSGTYYLTLTTESGKSTRSFILK